MEIIRGIDKIRYVERQMVMKVLLVFLVFGGSLICVLHVSAVRFLVGKTLSTVQFELSVVEFTMTHIMVQWNCVHGDNDGGTENINYNFESLPPMQRL
jgi:hypothetical protein